MKLTINKLSTKDKIKTKQEHKPINDEEKPTEISFNNTADNESTMMTSKNIHCILK